VSDDSSIPLEHEKEHLISANDDTGARDSAPATGETPLHSEAVPAAEDPQEGAVPPGYDWPTHGGYLGCLLSLMASCLIGGFLGTTLFRALGYPKVVTAVLTIVVYLGITVGLGRLGWILGKRFYREYPQTRRESSGRAGPEEKDAADEHGAQRRSPSAFDMPAH
jgi:hypothetical protein